MLSKVPILDVPSSDPVKKIVYVMAIGKWSIRWENGLDRGERKITTYALRHVLIIEIIEGSKKEQDGRGIEETKSRKPMERGRVEWEEEGNTDSRSSGKAALDGRKSFLRITVA